MQSQDLVEFSLPQVVLERPFHLSYPSAFAGGDGFHCLAEQGQTGTVALYRTEDPGQPWQESQVLLNPSARKGPVDPTLFRHQAHWWMFTLEDRKLHLYHAECPQGPWRAHQGNPVSTAFNCIRPAGQPFRIGANLYRPAQDCRQTYGGQLLIYRIEELSVDGYRESLIGELAPRPEWPYPDGLHTLNAAGGYVVFDAKRFL